MVLIKYNLTLILKVPNVHEGKDTLTLHLPGKGTHKFQSSSICIGEVSGGYRVFARANLGITIRSEVINRDFG